MSMIGNRLKALRDEKNVSQSDVARAIGVDRTAYVKYETGVSKPVRKIQELANYFNVSTDYLLGNDKPEEESAGKQHLAKYWRLNNTNRQMIDSLIEKILVSQGTAV